MRVAESVTHLRVLRLGRWRTGLEGVADPVRKLRPRNAICVFSEIHPE